MPNLELPLVAKIAKYTNLILNVGFLLSGFLLVVVGSYAFEHELPGLSSEYITIGVIVVGVIFAVVSFIGFLGLIRESRRFVTVYMVIVLALGIVEIAIAIAAYARKDDFPAIAYASWQHLFYNDGNAIISIEGSLECCGWHNVTDFALPPDCSTTAGFGYLVPCIDKVETTVNESYLAAGAIAAAVGTVQLVVLIFACITMRYFKPAQERDQALIEDDI